MHLCDDAIFSQDGKLSLIGIFEVVSVVALPGSLLKAFLVFNIDVLNKDLDKVDLNINLKKIDTRKEILQLPTLTPSFTKKNENEVSKLGLTLQLTNINFQEMGKYAIELSANKEVLGILEFEVKLQKQKGETN